MQSSDSEHDHELSDSNEEKTITPGEWIRKGIRASDEELAELQPKWEIPKKVGLIADIGHHLEAPGVIEQSIGAIEAGACAIHLHILDEEGNETTDLELWRQTLGQIKSETNDDLVINGGFRGDSFQEQMEFVREGLFDVIPTPCSASDPEYVKPAIDIMQEYDVKFKLGVSSPTDVLIAKNEYVDPGIVDSPTLWGVFLGAAYNGIPMDNPRTMARGLVYIIDLIKNVDPEAVISVTAQGRAGSYLSAQGILLGHNAKVGIGETRWRFPHADTGLHANSVAVEDAVHVARGVGREPATPAEYRSMIRGE